MKAHLQAQLLRRDGQLSDLSIELLVAGELDDAQRAAVEAHLLHHPEDRARVVAARGHQAGVTLQPRVAPVLSFQRRARLVIGVVATLGVAAAAAVWLTRAPAVAPAPPLPADGIRVKSAPLDFEVFVHDGEAQRKVDDGAAVAAGDRVGFRVKARGAGHVLVAAIDEQGAPYPCWPEGQSPAAAPWQHAEPVVLDRAMRLDATPGAERFVAVRCDAPFTFEAVSAALLTARESGWRAPPALPGCTLRVVRLEKR